MGEPGTEPHGGTWPPAAGGIRVLRVRTPDELARCQQVRHEVFVTEQGVSPQEEIDGRDEAPGTIHVLAVTPAGQPVGTARMLHEPTNAPGQQSTDSPATVQVGRVAVLARARGRAVGRALMMALEQIAATEYGNPVAGPGPKAGAGPVRVELAAQEAALGFYERLGYELLPGWFREAGIWHRHACKDV